MEAATLMSSGFAQWGNMEPLLPSSCSDPVVWGKPGVLCRNHMLEVARCCLWGCCILDSHGCCMKGCSSSDGCFHSLGHKAVLLAQGAKERLQNAPGCPPSLPHWRHTHKHMRLTLLQTGNLSPQAPPLRQQLAGAWTNTCTDRHCQASWWGPGSPSPSQPPTLAV